MSSHIAEKHKISKHSHAYDQLVSECSVVPSCYIVTNENSVRKMTEAEKAEVDESEVKTLESQRNTNSKLKAIMTDIIDVRKKLNHCSESEVEDLNRKKDKSQKEYN